MKDITIELLEKFVNGELTLSDARKQLLILYGIKEVYFFHRGYYNQIGDKDEKLDPKNFVSTEELIEVTEDFYNNTLIPMEEDIKKQADKDWHRPVKYMSNEIPEGKTLYSILERNED